MNTSVKYFFILLFYIGIAFPAWTQSVSIIDKYYQFKKQDNKEFAFLEVDRLIYYSGNDMHISSCILDQYFLPTQLSNILILELIGEDGQFRDKYYVKLRKGYFEGYIRIPQDIPTGNYQLIAYTEYMKNFDFEDLSIRRNIYIQNTAEPAEKVAKGYITPENDKAMDLETLPFGINVQSRENKVYVDIENRGGESGKYFLIAEGFGEIEFIAKVNVKKTYTNLAFEESNFKGSFQRIVLVSEELMLAGIAIHYLDKKGSYQTSFVRNDDTAEIWVKNNVVTVYSKFRDAEVQQDSARLFKRLYQLYYNLPSRLIDGYSRDQLLSKSTLQAFSSYSIDRWNRILAGESTEQPELAYPPAKKINLSGRIIGNTDLLDGAIMAVHFFGNDIDLLVPLDATGSFKKEIFWPIEDDQFYYFILDKEKNDVSDQYSVRFDSDEFHDYWPVADFYGQSLTDTLVNREREFNYILSTYNKYLDRSSLFWEGEKIDRTFPTNDFVGMSSIDDFIKEAVIDLTVTSKEGKKSINIYNSYTGKYDTPELVIVNDKIIKDASLIFEIPYEEIVSLGMIYSAESLKNFSEILRNGIVIISTNKRFVVPSEWEETRFERIRGYHVPDSKNELAYRFLNDQDTGLSTTKDYTHELIIEDEYSSPSGMYIELINRDGIYKRLGAK